MVDLQRDMLGNGGDGGRSGATTVTMDTKRMDSLLVRKTVAPPACAVSGSGKPIESEFAARAASVMTRCNSRKCKMGAC